MTSWGSQLITPNSLSALWEAACRSAGVERLTSQELRIPVSKLGSLADTASLALFQDATLPDL
eukprot:5041853-Amphidinium_carterae.1